MSSIEEIRIEAFKKDLDRKVAKALTDAKLPVNKETGSVLFSFGLFLLFEAGVSTEELKKYIDGYKLSYDLLSALRKIAFKGKKNKIRKWC